jgi:hypothetical protein
MYTLCILYINDHEMFLYIFPHPSTTHHITRVGLFLFVYFNVLRYLVTSLAQHANFWDPITAGDGATTDQAPQLQDTLLFKTGV